MGTRFLAGYGAEVMRIDPPGYFEPGGSSGGDLTLGKRCAFLDLKTEEGKAKFLELLSGPTSLSTVCGATRSNDWGSTDR